jgi:hypothetical protein
MFRKLPTLCSVATIALVLTAVPALTDAAFAQQPAVTCDIEGGTQTGRYASGICDHRTATSARSRSLSNSSFCIRCGSRLSSAASQSCTI